MNAEILEQAKQQAAICNVFGNARRVLIMWTLTDGEKSVGELADAIGTSLQNASQHLRVLKDKDFVRSRRVGQTIYYRIAENETMERCFVLLHSPLNEAVENQ
jgi:DNA-binding transcriptional ArsR family regulator